MHAANVFSCSDQRSEPYDDAFDDARESYYRSNYDGAYYGGGGEYDGGCDEFGRLDVEF